MNITKILAFAALSVSLFGPISSSESSFPKPGPESCPLIGNCEDPSSGRH
ncbi:hypothetical protein [Pseudoalteromonas luteoviolacea]|nr:hypothetical protein [Pseudoalteromonas luteoviolacea]